ncbi:MAG: hypothetical protein H6Q07_2964 [Acidobacteria bacterium]|nr:hypothetical protein [Acidobacteriota bacterium]
MYQGTKAGRLLAASMSGLVCVLLCVASANGQVTVGNKLKMLMNGSLGTVYSGNFGNYIGSSHSLGIGLNGTLEGYYYHPQFLSFQVRPYYDRAQSNSESQIITSGTGAEGSVSLFGGSHFPGSISYGRNFDSSSEFRIAGVPSILGDSSGSNFNVSWSALLSGLPSLNASYSMADSTSTLLGTTSQSKSSSRSFNLNSSYALGGFNLYGRLNHYDMEFLSPNFLTPESIGGTSSSTNYGVTATRNLPLSGSLGLGWSRTTSESGTSDYTSDSYTASASFAPWRRLSVSQIANYTTNDSVALARLSGDDTLSPLININSNSNAVYMNTTGTLWVGRGLTVTGYLNHRVRHFQENDLSNTQYGGTVNYQKANNFLGFLRFSIGIVDMATKEGNTGLGLVGNLGMTRKFGRWETAADVSYSQHTQTLVGFVTTSNYNYGGTLRRKLNESTHWGASFRESRSGLTMQEGNNNVSDSFTTNLSWNQYSFSGNYSRSKGEALLGADGTLTATPLGPMISDYFITFDARSYGLYASTQLFRMLTLSGAYTNVSSSTIRKTLGTFNNGDRLAVRLALRMRRLYIQAGFSHAVQESTAVSGGPRVVNSYYVSLSRWFNLF